MPSRRMSKKSKVESLSTPAIKGSAPADGMHSDLPSNDAAGGAKRKAVFEGPGVGATPKRRKGLGVRVIGGRIYDSENGRTCHQCRQKTIEYMAPCKSIIGKKSCTQNFCPKCLQNRYGEKVTEVNQVETWTCPKCRGICNCSICMKKQGRTPTGILSPTAKATGFGSVAELLQKCPDIKSETFCAVSSPGKSTPRDSVSSPCVLAGDLKAAKVLNQISPKKPSSAKAGVGKALIPSTALLSLTNQDLNIPCKKEQETVEESVSVVKQTSKKVGLMKTTHAVRATGAVQYMNGMTDGLKVKKPKTASNQLEKGFDSVRLIEDKEVEPKEGINAQKGIKKRNAKAPKNEVSSVEQLTGDEKVSLPSSLVAKTTKSNQAKTSKQKTIQEVQAAKGKKMILPERSYQEPTVEKESGKTLVSKSISAKQAVDGQEQIMNVKSSDLGLGASKMQSSLKSGDPQKKKRASRKLTVSINGDVDGAFACVNPVTTKKQKAATMKHKSKQISGQGNEEALGGAIEPIAKTDLQSQALPTKPRKRKHKTAGDNSTQGSNVKTEEKETDQSAVHDNMQGQALPKKVRKKKEKAAGDAHAEDNLVMQETEQSEVKAIKSKESKQSSQKVPKSQVSLPEEEIILPNGEQLVTVAGMEVPADVVGPALQLLEFCSAFNKMLGLKKGEAEALLREFTRGRILRRGSQSLLIQLHVKLLSLIVEDSLDPCTVTYSSSGKNSWMQVLKRHLNERSCIFASNAFKCDANDNSLHTVDPTVFVIPQKDLMSIKAAIQEGPEGYEKLDMCKKLQLLTILCDDCLDTECLRNYIEAANREYSEAQKENREEALAARKEAKEANQKRRDAEVARVLALTNNNAPLSLEEESALLSKVQMEIERAVAAKSMMSEAASKMQRSRTDAVRTDPIVLVKDGRVFYKLKGANERKAVVFQDISNTRSSTQDCWSVYSEEEEAVLAKYLRSCRVKRSRRKSIPGEQSAGSTEQELSEEDELEAKLEEDELEAKPELPAEAENEVSVNAC